MKGILDKYNEEIDGKEEKFIRIGRSLLHFSKDFRLLIVLFCTHFFLYMISHLKEVAL